MLDQLSDLQMSGNVIYYRPMSKRYTQVPLSYLQPIFEDWRQTFSQGHLVNVFFMPCGDVLFRAMQFSDWMQEQYGEKVHLINFETELIVNPENLEEILKHHENEKLILLAKHVFMRPDAGSMVGVLERWYAEYGRGALILCEGFPAEIAEYVPKPVMTQRQLIHKVYPEEVALQYLYTTAVVFGVEVNQVQAKEIVAHCGGIPWLINDVLRRIGDQDLFTNDILLWKVEQIAKVIPHLPGREKDIVDFGLKNKEGKWIPIFDDYFAHMAKQKLQISSAAVYYDNRDLSASFSPGERRILAHLFTNDSVVKREELGKLFWQDSVESEYSDWALDAIMSRIRKKLDKLGLPLIIKTRRGRGYERS